MDKLRALPLVVAVLALAACVRFFQYDDRTEPDAAGDAGSDARNDADGDSDADGDLEGDADPRLDGDGDTISDAHEGNGDVDTDDDGTPDSEDSDSDDDTIPDRREAGDTDLTTPPIDTDADGVPDFRDSDSDDDGVSDRDEVTLHDTDPLNPDTDEDGVSDLVELVAGTDPTDGTETPMDLGDFVFVSPFGETPAPGSDTLEFSTVVEHADVYFLLDTTGSMSGELTNLQRDLSTVIIPGVQDAIPDAWFGVGQFEDYAAGGHGSPGDEAFHHVQNVTADVVAAQAAVNTLVLGGGADGPEAAVPALHAVATGCGDGTGTTAVPDDPGGACHDGAFIGYPHFRAGAVPVIVVITDAEFHNGPGEDHAYGFIEGVTPPTFFATVAALNDIHARIVGINSGVGTLSARPHLEQLARATGSVGPGGPLVYDIAGDGTSLGDQVITAVEEAAASVPMNITAIAIDDDGSDGVDAVATFIAYLETDRTCSGDLTTRDSDGDGRHDTFVAVLPGTTVCFAVVPRVNDTIPSGAEPAIYTATIQVWGDQVTLLDSRQVYFLIP